MVVELVAFKANHGNYNAPTTPSSKYNSLGIWYSHMGVSYKQIQEEGEPPRSPLSYDQIGSFEALGFEWSRNTTTFEERLTELATFKAKY